ncbi:hypothetical protein [Leptospirillum ferrooxidans]|jgi:hypothetical protein|uniref:Uncharacterized protein n=1 Tax=Leptospirillum ferrooxidans (strain C2-3) TaxID=1162668 RepID=I0IPG6_LEPFC|nr:hypothetical protein [Leptospirillum ferrooxidans]BAM07165.1 hypothetical protein LFE_1483 [Leptospirillum ferrooxidans C2-3]
MDHGLLLVGAIFLTIGSLFGVVLVTAEVMKKSFPKPLGFIHPTLAMIGFLMIVARHFILGPLKYMDWGILSLVGSVFFGLALLVRGFRGLAMLRLFTFCHGMLGLLGLGLVLYQVSLRPGPLFSIGS